ncbi:MAG: hypothetical protein J2P46_22110, partial [Zavarzinella sp.]|nr:hypothetical protein [Zavarzinella sp.]
MSRVNQLFCSSAARPKAGRNCRLGVAALEAREVPATFVANIFDDPFFFTADGLSLRQAISRANANPGPDTIVLKAGTYTQSLVGNDNTNAAGDFDVIGPLTIVGAGPGSTVITGNHTDRLFDVIGPGTVRFSDLALIRGGTTALNGGAVQALSANIVLDNVLAVENLGQTGGAINAEGGAVTVRRSQLLTNSAAQE